MKDPQSLYHVAEAALVYRTFVAPSERPKITASQDAYNILKELWNQDTVELQEEFKVLLLNRANKVMGIVPISTGGVSGTVADLKLIFVAALKGVASGIIVSHNHPSGNLTPSSTDISLTKRIREAGKILDIQLLDHIIYTTEGYYSFADEGKL